MNETKLKDAIWRAWFAPLGGLAPSSETDGGPLFNAVAAELLAAYSATAGAEDPLSEIENAIDALVNDLDRVRTALHDLTA